MQNRFGVLLAHFSRSMNRLIIMFSRLFWKHRQDIKLALERSKQLLYRKE